MYDRVDFEGAKRALSLSNREASDFCLPFTSLFAVSGAAVSVLVAGSAGQSTVSASDATAARLDELQFDLGEGPCWDALSTRTAVVSVDVRADARQRWPAFGEAITSDAATSIVASLFAFPMTIGSLDLGAVDLYASTTGPLDDTSIADAIELASVAAWQVLRSVLGDRFEEPIGYSRREVHQATGMVIAQLGVSADDAALLLRAHAFATGRSVRDLANDVVELRIDFSDDGRSTTPTVGS